MRTKIILKSSKMIILNNIIITSKIFKTIFQKQYIYDKNHIKNTNPESLTQEEHNALLKEISNNFDNYEFEKLKTEKEDLWQRVNIKNLEKNILYGFKPVNYKPI